jgi:WD40 repeat protein
MMQYMDTIYNIYGLGCCLLKIFLMQVKSKLKGHSKRITGLAFSHLLNVLVSSGADAQVTIFIFRYVLQIGLAFLI